MPLNPDIYRLSQSVKDEKSRTAIAQLERLTKLLFERISEAEETTDSLVTGVASVTAGNSTVSISPTVGAVVVQVALNGIGNTHLRDSAALSVIGRATNTSGDPADIAAGSDGHILGRASSALSFATPATFGIVTGTGTSGRSTRWTGTSTVGNGAFTDDGTNVSLGGTLTLTPMTPGSVLFAGTGGLVTQDNAGLFYDDSSNALVVGAAGITKPSTSAVMEVTRTNNTARLLLSSYSATHNSVVYLYRGRGTPGSTSAIQSGDQIGAFAFTGATGSGAGNFFDGASVIATATENWSAASNFGAKLEFTTTTNAAGSGGRAVRMVIDHDGEVGIGQTTPTERLHVEGSAATGILCKSTAAAAFIEANDAAAKRIRIQANNSGNPFIGTLTNHPVDFQTNNALKATMGTDGSWALNATGNGVFQSMVNGSGAAVSAASTGRIRYNTTGQIFQVSLNGAAYAPLAVGSGTVNVLPRWSTTTGGLVDSAITDDGATIAMTRAVTMSSTLAVTGAITENGVAVLAGTIAANTIPKGSSGNLVDSAITDDGTTIVWNGRKMASTLTVAGTHFSLSMTGTGLTANGVVADYSSSATYDTTAGALSAVGASYIMFGSRSAGANNLSQVAGLFSSTGAQVNIALRTNSGMNWLNVTDSNTVIGYSAGTGPSSHKLSVNGDATATAIGAVNTQTGQGSHTGISSALSGTVAAAADRTATGISSNVTVTRASGAANAINKACVLNASGGQVNTALETQSGNNYLNAVGNSTGVGYATGATLPAKFSTTGSADFLYTAAAQNATLCTWTPVAATTGNFSVIRANANGTYDTTAGVLTSFGVAVVHSATRSAGANNLTNIAVHASSSGAQVNIAFRSDAGDNNFNTGSGSTGVGYAIGSSLPAKFSVTGGIYLSTDIEIDGALNHDGTTVGFYGVAPVVRPAVTALTDSSGGTANNTVQALTNPADTPATADALRDDLVANLIPELRNNFADLAAKINEIRTVLLNVGLLS